jgi:hypothetical protein
MFASAREGGSCQLTSAMAGVDMAGLQQSSSVGGHLDASIGDKPQERNRNVERN